MSSENKKDNIRYINDYIKKDKSIADKIVSVVVLGSGMMSGHLVYKIVHKSFDEICYVLNIKPTGSRVIAFTTGYGVMAGTIYKLDELYSIIKEVSNGRS